MKTIILAATLLTVLAQAKNEQKTWTKTCVVPPNEWVASPRTVVINADENTGKAQVQSDQETKECDLRVVTKKELEALRDRSKQEVEIAKNSGMLSKQQANMWKAEADRRYEINKALIDLVMVSCIYPEHAEAHHYAVSKGRKDSKYLYNDTGAQNPMNCK